MNYWEPYGNIRESYPEDQGQGHYICATKGEDGPNIMDKRSFSIKHGHHVHQSIDLWNLLGVLEKENPSNSIQPS